ncbi:MAG: DUF5110 domain-containing protein [Terriglobia bacterium]
MKAGTLLPLAAPSLHSGDPAGRKVTVKVYGDGSLPFSLYEDDDLTLDALAGKYNRVSLTWDNSKGEGRAERIGSGGYPQYEITRWERA